MGDFIEQTALEQTEEGCYRAVLHSDWMTWGPAGGYVAAIALQAAGRATRLGRPASFACQYLSVARFDAIELRVETLRSGRRSEALHVEMTQEGKPILDANVWAVETGEGMEHDYTQPPEVPAFDELKDVRELDPERQQLGVLQNFDRRPTEWEPNLAEQPREPVMSAWCRFRPAPTAKDLFVDAARSVILLDSFSWPATWPAHPSKGPSPWIAPNLDLHVRFHHDARADDWLLFETRAELAATGLIGTSGTIWSPDGKLIAAGSSQLFCRPRPERFR
ncbi:MAG: thioesterase family protein [bacterium]|nr:thioesterase family protein [bacterium]MCP5067326.1 thioesterase family protein [bacterium]